MRREIARQIGPGAEIVEFGAGALRKVRLLLGALQTPRASCRSTSRASTCAAPPARCAPSIRALDVRPVVADFTQAARAAAAPRGRRVGFFPGSSIGNFDPTKALRLPAALRARCCAAAGC